MTVLAICDAIDLKNFKALVGGIVEKSKSMIDWSILIAPVALGIVKYKPPQSKLRGSKEESQKQEETVKEVSYRSKVRPADLLQCSIFFFIFYNNQLFWSISQSLIIDAFVRLREPKKTDCYLT